MLDEQHGQIEGAPDPADQRPQLVDLLVTEPAGWLVEQEQPRARRKRPCELDPLHRPEGETPGPALRHSVETELAQQLARRPLPA